MPSAEKRKAVVFDLDGTLVDSLADLAAALRKTLHEEGHDNPEHFTADVVRPFVGRGASHLVEGVLREAWGKTPSASQVQKTLGHFGGIYQKAMTHHTRPFDGIEDMLKALRADGFRLAVATNKPSALAKEVVAELLPGQFEVVLGPEDAGAHKPDPTMVRLAGEKLNAEVMAFVGDSMVDVATAQKGDYRCVAVAWGLGQEAELVASGYPVAKSMAELLSHIRQAASQA